MVPPAGVHVLGSGSIGLLVAWHLRRMQVPVTLLTRSTQAASALSASDGLMLEYHGKDAGWMRTLEAPLPRQPMGVELALPGRRWRTIVPDGRCDPSDDADSEHPPGPISQLVVATKAADTVSALQSVVGRLGDGADVLLLQNGLLGLWPQVHSQVVAAGAMPRGVRVLLGSVTHGAYRRDPAHVVQSCTGAIMLAPADAALAELTDPRHEAAWGRLPGGATTAAPHAGEAAGARTLVERVLAVPGLNAQLVPSHAELMRQIHRKLAVNCAVNPATALLGCFNDELTSSPWGAQIVRAVCAELHELYGGRMLGFDEASQLSEFVLQVASGTGRNKNSMLQDVTAGRPTEIDFINGYAVQCAQQQGKSAPVNALLHALIKAKEECATTAQSTDTTTNQPT